jgi:hypothetical protein
MIENLKNKFGPCGILCEKCFAFDKGPIHHHSEKLKYYLGDFDNYAKRFVTLLDNPAFAKYPDFKELLNIFASANCHGCRKQDCRLFKGCKVKDCHKTENVDYCFQCSKFPCKDTGFDDNLKKRWLKINSRILEIGLDNYYVEIKDKPRY